METGNTKNALAADTTVIQNLAVTVKTKYIFHTKLFNVFANWDLWLIISFVRVRRISAGWVKNERIPAFGEYVKDSAGIKSCWANFFMFARL